jgi:hypothetical protein
MALKTAAPNLLLMRQTRAEYAIAATTVQSRTRLTDYSRRMLWPANGDTAADYAEQGAAWRRLCCWDTQAHQSVDSFCRSISEELMRPLPRQPEQAPDNT